MSDLVKQEDGGAYREGLGFALWCLIFVGLGGIHRIYLGKYGTGILWLLTGGLFFIGQFIDLFRMKGLVYEANVREGYLPHPRIAQQIAYMGSPPAKSLRHQLLDAAVEHGGRISVTEGVAATGRTFKEVEDELRKLLETGYVDVDVEGTRVVYRFTELG